MYFFSLLNCSISNKPYIQTRQLLSSASIRFFIFHHFSQKPQKKLCDYPIDILLVTYISVVQWLACSPQVLYLVESRPCQVKPDCKMCLSSPCQVKPDCKICVCQAPVRSNQTVKYVFVKSQSDQTRL